MNTYVDVFLHADTEFVVKENVINDYVLSIRSEGLSKLHIYFLKPAQMEALAEALEAALRGIREAALADVHAEEVAEIEWQREVLPEVA